MPVIASSAPIPPGGAREEAIGRRCYEVSHRIDAPCDQAGESCPLSLARETGVPQRVLHRHHTPHGDELVDVTITPIVDEAQQTLWFVETLLTVRQASSRPAAQGLVGRSPAFQSLLQRLLRVAPSESSVLLLGETGTGKKLLARAIHESSPRARGPFVAVDCSGLTETLFESELFGYEKGAFTGATHRKLGLIEAASGGTLFLDEITASTFFRCTRLRSPNGPRTFRFWRLRCSSASIADWGASCRRRRSNTCCIAVSKAISASCAIWPSAPASTPTSRSSTWNTSCRRMRPKRRCRSRRVCPRMPSCSPCLYRSTNRNAFICAGRADAIEATCARSRPRSAFPSVRSTANSKTCAARQRRPRPRADEPH